MKLALGLTNPLVHIRKELAIGTVMDSLLSASTIRQMTSVLTSHVRTALTGFVRRTAHLESRNRLALTMLFNETTRRRWDLTLCPRPARRVRLLPLLRDDLDRSARVGRPTRLERS